MQLLEGLLYSLYSSLYSSVFSVGDGSGTSCIVANADGENTVAARADSQFLQKAMLTLSGMLLTTCYFVNF